MISKNQIKQIRQLEQKKYRRREQMFVAEGPKVVGDLLAEGLRPLVVYATEEWQPVCALAESQVVTADELCKVSFLQHPQQVLALFPLPEADARVTPVGQLSLALDGVQDPGNLGTIIRLADWFGIDTIYCSEDTVDAWSPKVVQATMGSIARVHIIYMSLSDLLGSLPAAFPVYGTVLDGDDIYSSELSAGEGIIIMGNEGNGISSEIRRKLNRRLLIPNFSRHATTAESLNVAIATAIVCSEFRRRDG